MIGLRTQETDKFNRFFALIQEEAERKNSVFFADAGDGNDFETPTMEGEEMMGWLIPKEKADEFMPLWEKGKVDDTWSAYYTWALWEINNNSVKIRFEG